LEKPGWKGRDANKRGAGKGKSSCTAAEKNTRGGRSHSHPKKGTKGIFRGRMAPKPNLPERKYIHGTGGKRIRVFPFGPFQSSGRETEGFCQGCINANAVGENVKKKKEERMTGKCRGQSVGSVERSFWGYGNVSSVEGGRKGRRRGHQSEPCKTRRVIAGKRADCPQTVDGISSTREEAIPRKRHPGRHTAGRRPACDEKDGGGERGNSDSKLLQIGS